MKKEVVNDAPSAEQIAEWKEKYGIVFRLTADDGKQCYIKDPFSSIHITKLAFAALYEDSDIAFVQSILNNCWLFGDEELRVNESYSIFLTERMKDITDMPKCDVRKEGSKFIMTVDGMSCEVRMAMRADIIKAEQKNRAREPFETNINLLDIIKLKGVDEIKKNSIRSYLGLLTGVDKVKNKTYVAVEKL
jgi:hypothetical protein